MKGSETYRVVRRDRGLLLWLVVVAALAGGVPELRRELGEQRWFRDAAGLTPFHSVTVSLEDMTPEGLMLAGEMVKRRCEYVRLTAYAVGADGRSRRIRLDISLEESGARGNRPAYPGAQDWGPWLLMWSRELPAPLRWYIYAHHRCPGAQIEQTNLFASGVWPNGGSQ